MFTEKNKEQDSHNENPQIFLLICTYSMFTKILKKSLERKQNDIYKCW